MISETGRGRRRLPRPVSVSDPLMQSLHRPLPRPTPALLALFALVALVLMAFAPPAMAATGDAPGDETTRWSVTPSDANGPDGRRSIEIEVDPGETVDDHIAVRNLSDSEVVFSLTAADGFYTRSGRFDILAGDAESVDAGSWISIPETVTVAPDATAVIPVTITVPDRAEPGDHAAGITASVLSVQRADDGTNVGVDSRVGIRVSARVTGEITPAASIPAVAGDYRMTWSPVHPGSASVTFDLRNDGNTRLRATGTVAIGGQVIPFPAAGENPQELLPGDTRTLTVQAEDVWPLFAVGATVTFAPTVLTIGDAAAPTMDPVTAETVVWAIPGPQLLCLAGVALVVGAILWGRTRSRRRIATLIASAREQARAEGREEALSAPPSSESEAVGVASGSTPPHPHEPQPHRPGGAGRDAPNEGSNTIA